MSIQEDVISKRFFISTIETDFSMNEERHDVLQESVSDSTDDKNDEHGTTDVV